MARPKAKRKTGKKALPHSEWEYLRAHVADDGELEMRWKLVKSIAPGGQVHDENVGTWTDDEIISLVKNIAGVVAGDPVKVEVIRG